jgi:hypothetical protein
MLEEHASERRQSMPRSVTRLCLVLALFGVFALVPRGSGASALTLTPPPPTGATCHTTGSDIFCHGDDTFTATNLDQFSCGTFEVLATFTQSETYELHYNFAGLALEETFHENAPATFINSVTGQTITGSGYFTLDFVFATPGDFSTLTQTLTGAGNISTGPHFGLVTHDVGRVVIGPNGDILFLAGSMPQVDNLPGFIQAVCTALS